MVMVPTALYLSEVGGVTGASKGKIGVVDGARRACQIFGVKF